MTLSPPSIPLFTADQMPAPSDFNTYARDAFGFLRAAPRFRGWQSVSQSIPTGITTRVSIDTVIEDTYSAWVAASNSYLAPVDGWYLCIGSTQWPSVGATAYGIRTQLGAPASPIEECAARNLATSTGPWGVLAMDEIYLRGGIDSVVLTAWQNSGGNISTVAGGINNCCYLEIIWTGE